MDVLNILVTGAGAPGIKGTLYSLKNNFDVRKINVIGTDAERDVIGKYLGDSFYRIPKASEILYIEELSSICKKEFIDVLFSQNTLELSILRGIKYISNRTGQITCLNIIESNPRIQGTMILSTLAGANVIYGAVKHALGEEIPQFNIQWGTKLMRYWGVIGIKNGILR